MLKKSLFVLAFTSFLFSNTFQIGDKIKNFSLLNQFDKKTTINKKLEKIIVVFEKKQAENVNEFLSLKESSFLKNHKTIFIADISQMPSLITKYFAIPKMKTYKYPIFLIYDENYNRFQHKENKITIYILKDGLVKNIRFITKEELEKEFK